MKSGIGDSCTSDEDIASPLWRRWALREVVIGGRGLRLVNSAREYYETMIGLRKEAAEAEAGCVAAKRKAEELVAAAEKAEAEARMKIAEAKKLRSRAGRGQQAYDNKGTASGRQQGVGLDLRRHIAI